MNQSSPSKDFFWRFDALDARGGLAFASFRDADLTADKIDDVYAVHVGPPSFSPEPVLSRALGCAAFRGAFQPGLFLGEHEVAFSTLSSLIEFVRRGYMAGGGGDSANGGGSGVPPVLGEGPTDTDTPDVESSYGEGGMAGDLASFCSASDSLKFTADRPISYVNFTWLPSQAENSGQAAPNRTFDLGEDLVLAARDLAIELLRRFPGTRDSRLYSRWQASADRLGRAYDELWLWRKVLEGPEALPLGLAMAAAVDRSPEFWYNPKWFADELKKGSYDVLGTAACDLFGVWLPEWVWDRRHLRLSGRCHSQRALVESDPSDDLASWPLPMTLRRAGLAAENLLELLTLFTGAPRRIARLKGRAVPAAIHLVAFGAAHLAKAADALTRQEWSSWPHYTGPPDSYWTYSAAQRGLDWLASQMPRMAFPPPVEDVIGEVADLNYRKAERIPSR
jgi:hypothetical protein